MNKPFTQLSSGILKTLGSSLKEQYRAFNQKYFKKFEVSSLEPSLRRVESNTRADLRLLFRSIDGDTDDHEDAKVASFFLEISEWSDSRRDRFFEAVLPGIGRHFSRKWMDFSKWPTGRTVFRSPNNPQLISSQRFQCFFDLLMVRGSYPASMCESLEDLIRIGGFLGGNFSNSIQQTLHFASFNNSDEIAVGTVLSSAFDEQNNESVKLLDLATKIWCGDKNEGVLGSHIPTAFARSSRADLHDRLAGWIQEDGCTHNNVRILCMSMLSEFALTKLILQEASKTGFFENRFVTQMWLNEMELCHKELPNNSSLVTSCISALNGKRQRSDSTWLPSFLEHWALALEDIDSLAVKLSESKHPSEQGYKNTLVEFCKSTRYEALTAALNRSSLVNGPERRVAEFMLQTKKSKALPLPDDQALQSTIQLAKEFLGPSRKSLLQAGVDPRDLELRVIGVLKSHWSNQSLSVLGGIEAQPEFRLLSFLPSDYIPPDSYSISLVLANLEPPDCLFEPINPTSRFLKMLLQSNLGDDDWIAILSMYPAGSQEIYPFLLDAIYAMETERINSLLTRILRQKQSSKRSIGLVLLLNLLNSRHCDEVKKRSSEFLAMLKEDTNSEIQLVQRVRAALQISAKTLPSPSNDFFPSLKMTDTFEPLDTSPSRNTKELGHFLSSLDRWIAKHERIILKHLTLSDFPEWNLKTARVFTSASDRPMEEWRKAILGIFEKWFRKREKNTFSPDGAVLARAYSMRRDIYDANSSIWKSWIQRKLPLDELKQLQKDSVPVGTKKTNSPTCIANLKYPNLIEQAIDYLFATKATWDDRRYCLAIAEAIYSRTPSILYQSPGRDDVNSDGSFVNPFSSVLLVKQWCRLSSVDRSRVATMPIEHLRRLWNLQRLTQQPMPLMEGDHGLNEVDFAAFGHGIATLGDLAYGLLNSTVEKNFVSQRLRYEDVQLLGEINKKKAREWETFATKLGDAMVQGEIKRNGKSLAPLSFLIPHVEYLPSYENFETLLANTSRSKPEKPSANLANRRSVQSSLLGCFFPASDDDSKEIVSRLRKLVSRREVSKQRLLEAGILAPQWLPEIDRVLGLRGTREFLYWFVSHNEAIEAPRAFSIWEANPNVKDLSLCCKQSIFHRYPVFQQRFDSSGWASSVSCIADSYVEKQWLIDVLKLQSASSLQLNALKKALLMIATKKQIEEAWLLIDCTTGKRSISSVLKMIRAAKSEVDLRPIGLCGPDKNLDNRTDLAKRLSVMRDYREQHGYDLDARRDISDKISAVRDMLVRYLI